LGAFSQGQRVGSVSIIGNPPLGSGPLGSPEGTIKFNTTARAGFNQVSLSAPNDLAFAIANVRATPNIAAIVQGSVQVNTTTNNTQVVAIFNPNNRFGLSLANAAALGGFSNFEWVSTIRIDPGAVLGSAGGYPGPVKLPFPDPPPGGYGPSTANRYPFYWNINSLTTSAAMINGHPVAIQGTNYTLFTDLPISPYLLPGQFLEFETSLVGICGAKTLGCAQFQGYSLEDLFNLVWTSNYNSKVGGVSIPLKSNDIPGDPGGRGGVTILSKDFPLGVPGPTIGAGLPGLIAACAVLLAWWRRKRHAQAVA
jgi:hypothetical protein